MPSASVVHRRALSVLLSIGLVACGVSPTPEASTGGGGGGPSSEPSAASATPIPSIDVEAIITEVLDEQKPFEQEATEAQPAVFTSSNQAGETNLIATEQYVDAVIRHADTIWTNYFLSYGFQEPWVGYDVVQPGETYNSNCALNGQTSFASDYPNAFFCHLDPSPQAGDYGYLMLPAQTMAKMWTGNIFERQVSNLKRVGDFAAGMMIAHEFGHHIQHEFSEQLQKPGPGNPNSELIADCFSGVWAYSVFLASYLEEGDIDEALNALEVIGDASGSHGTGEQRKNAFMIGYTGSQSYPYGGVPANCLVAFWPEIYE